MEKNDFLPRGPGTAIRRDPLAVRASLAGELGQAIDGAWWPRGGNIARELPAFVKFAAAKMGEVTGLAINWPEHQRPPDLNWNGWRDAPQHIVVVQSAYTRATVLVIPYETNQTLARILMQMAAFQPTATGDRTMAIFGTAQQILDAARQQCQMVADPP